MKRGAVYAPLFLLVKGAERLHTVMMIISACLLMCPAYAQGAQSDDILGVWNTPDGKGAVKIVHCGTCYCGRIVRLSEPAYPPDDGQGMGGRPRVDRNNPDPALRSRPALGLQVLDGFAFTAPDRWEGGTIYDPESGNTYKGRLMLTAPDCLRVRGYIGITLFGRTSVWTRAR